MKLSGKMKIGSYLFTLIPNAHEDVVQGKNTFEYIHQGITNMIMFMK